MRKANEAKEKKKEVVSTLDEKKTIKGKKHYIAEKKSPKKVKEKKDNIFKLCSKYFKGVFKEFKRIRWTEGKDLLKYSLCTVAFVIFFGVYFYAIDWVVLLLRSLAK